MDKDLNYWLDFYYVTHRDQLGEDTKKTIKWWDESFPYGVGNEDSGIIALFKKESTAYFFRMMLINQKLNDGWNRTNNAKL